MVMELDVYITRDPKSTWGFTLVGGNDSEIPLTVIKVVPDSPADRAGLQNGDTVLRIGDHQTTDMSHAAASNAVTAAVDNLVLGVVRGLYDPVLDDFEPIYEPVDQEDSDQPSDPTEVFRVAEFIEVPPPLDNRSLTASPFPLPTKPYRPFSTEPTDVPPLEDPIILNPEYKDVFPQHEVEDILQIKPDIPPASRFKLPISEQYDPEGKRIKKLVEEKYKHEIKEEKREERKEMAETRSKQKEVKIKEEEFLEKMKKDIDLEKIEMTASEIVEETIQKAVAIAEEIKQEIDMEISSKEEKFEKSEHKSEKKETKFEQKSEIKEEKQEMSKVEVKEDAKTVNDLVELIDKTTEEIIKQNEKKDIKKEVEKIESGQDAAVEERKLARRQEIEEIIEDGSVRRKSMVFESEAKVVERRDVEKKESGETIKKDKQATQSKEYQKEVKAESVSVNEQRRRSDAKTSTSRLLAEQRAYTIGLQTIPNIRGSTHSSYHYNLLLKTFFIHLTDVMVALSRFILTEPVFSEERQISQELVTVTETVSKEKEKVKKDVAKHEGEVQKEKKVKEQVVYERKDDSKDVEMKAAKVDKEIIVEDKKATSEVQKQMIVEDKKDEVKKEIIVKNQNDFAKEQKTEKVVEKAKQIVQDAKEEVFAHNDEQRKVQDLKEEMIRKEIENRRDEREMLDEELDEEFYEEEEFIETRRKTGAEMAQMVERKSADLIEKLDAVITEFQGKAGIEVPDKNVTIHRRTRSRSRSKADRTREMTESEPLELSYDSGRQSRDTQSRQSRDITEIEKTTKIYESKKMESRHEVRQLKTPVPQPVPEEVPVVPPTDGNITYVAIVESHVYTNKDAIFEEMARKTVEESMERSRTEKLMESKVTKEEVAQTVIQKAREMEQKSVELIQPIQIVEDVKSVQMHQASTVIETAATDIAQSSEVIIEEVQDEVLKIQEPPAKSVEVVYEATAKSVAESSEAYVEEVKAETLEITQPKAMQAKELLETAKSVAESTEVKIEEVKHEEFIVEEPVVTQAAEVIVENKATAVAEATSVPVQKGKTVDEASAELKIVKYEPVDVEEPVVVISEVELELLKRDVADAKIYESIVGVQTAVQEKHETLDVSQTASYKSVGETKIDKTINLEEVEEVPVQVIAKTEVSVEGLNEEATKVYQEALAKESIDESYEAKAITLETAVEERKETQIEKAQSIQASVKEASFEAKSVSKAKSVSEASFEATTVSEASYEAKSVAEASFEAKSVSEASFEAKSAAKASFETKSVSKAIEEKTEASVSEASFEAKSVSAKKSVEQSQESAQKVVQAEQKVVAEEKVAKKEIESIKTKEEEPIVNGAATPPTPETPVTDEYLFKLEIPLPKTTVQVPRDCSPEDDDPNIVKKKLVPHIDTSIESYTYEPPLPTPPAGRELGSPEYKKPGLQGGSRLKNMRYYKPGLRGGADKPEMTKEEIMEIERTSSLLASAIDKTIKSIEEYKEEVGIEAKKQMSMSSKVITSSKFEHKTLTSNGHSNGTSIKETAKEIKDSYDKEWKEIEKQVENNHKDVNELTVNVTIEEANGDSKNGKENTDERVHIIELEVSARNNGHPNGHTETKENGIKSEETKVVKATETHSESNKANGTIKISFDLKESDTQAKSESATEAIITKSQNGHSEERVIETKKVRKEATVKEEYQSQKANEVSRDVSTVKTEAEESKASIKEESQAQNGISTTIKTEIEEPKVDPMQLYRPVKFDPEEIARRKQLASLPIIQEPTGGQDKPKIYMTDTGEIIGTQQGIVDGLEEAVVDSEVAKALGKPGMPDEKIAELISGEAEMLREAHVMGLARVLSSRIHRADDDSVDFQKIKPVIESLKDSEVLKALNEEVLRAKEQKKKEEKKWTTFLQKPKRPPPRAKYGYYGYVEEEKVEEEPYKVKIVKQPKPKVAPDYKPEDFDTGPLPWEQPQPEFPGGPIAPVEPEEPILIPEESPEFLEAVDPLPESEVPDLEDTGIPLPPPRQIQVEPEPAEPEFPEEVQQELDLDEVLAETEQIVEEMEGERLAEQLLQNVQKMVDPNATLEQQLAQMRAQIAALAQLPCVIQQTLDLVTRQISQLSHQGSHTTQEREVQPASPAPEPVPEVTIARAMIRKPVVLLLDEPADENQRASEERQYQVTEENNENSNQREQQQSVEITEQESQPMLSEEELARRKKQEEEMMAEQQKIEKQRKIEHWNQIWPWGNSKHPHCRKYRINFMKYEKPPVNLDHLQHSEVYKVVHNLDERPRKRVETLTPVIAEADYRERCRSVSPYPGADRVSIPQQLQP